MKKLIRFALLRVRPSSYLLNAIALPVLLGAIVSAAFLIAPHLLFLFRLFLVFIAANLVLAVISKVAQLNRR